MYVLCGARVETAGSVDVVIPPSRVLGPSGVVRVSKEHSYGYFRMEGDARASS
jgi:hypothetical protein